MLWNQHLFGGYLFGISIQNTVYCCSLWNVYGMSPTMHIPNIPNLNEHSNFWDFITNMSIRPLALGIFACFLGALETTRKPEVVHPIISLSNRGQMRLTQEKVAYFNKSHAFAQISWGSPSTCISRIDKLWLCNFEVFFLSSVSHDSF